VCAEEVVMEDNIDWSLPPDVAVEEEIVGPASDRSGDTLSAEENEIPLNDETYATYHPFPCDFCSRRLV